MKLLITLKKILFVKILKKSKKCNLLHRLIIKKTQKMIDL